MSEGRVVTLRVARGEGGAPSWATYRVPYQERMTVLDALLHVQNYEDPTLAFRYSCRVGMCGTCTLMVGGRPRWACRTRVGNLGADAITLAPLRHLPVLRDLMVDMGPFFERYRRAKPFVALTEEAGREPARIPPDSRERRQIDPHIECITCGACYAACSMVRWDPGFLGPAALNRAATLLADSRDGAGAERLRLVADEHGVWRCHSQFNCTEVCPMGLDPTQAIAALKRRAAGRGIREFVGRLAGRGAALATG